MFLRYMVKEYFYIILVFAVAGPFNNSLTFMIHALMHKDSY